MLFSIITVTYNAASTLPTTLRSVAEQSCTDYEHLIVDGASRDATIDLIKEAAATSPRVTYISERDSGIYDAMNKGLMRAQGEYLIFLNAGDAFTSSDTLTHICEAIERNNHPSVVYGQTQLVDSTGRRIADRHLRAPEHLTYKSFARGMVVCHQAFVVKAEIAPMYSRKYRLSADYEWCIRCLQQSDSNVYMDETLIDYLSEGASTANRRRSLWERFRIMCYYYGTLPTVLRHLAFIPRFVRHKILMKKNS